MATELDLLTDELNAWYDANGLEHESADDATYNENLTAEQREYLYDFIDRWETAARRER